MNNKCIRVGIVSYKNTAPLLYGLQKLADNNEIELIKNYPAKIADDLIENKIDVGLVPIAILPLLKKYYIVGTHCIASNKNVASVCLFSNVPIQEIKNVLLDYQSRTSVQLVKVLFKNFWKQDVQFIDANENFINEIIDTTAAVIIGDRAFENLNNYKYCYDLAEAWFDYTNLPFVFAMWISTTLLSNSFIDAFDAANALGLQHIPQIVKEQNYNFYDLQKYYTQNICFSLDDDKLKSVERFLKEI